jgi:hypothetical protein
MAMPVFSVGRSFVSVGENRCKSHIHGPVGFRICLHYHEHVKKDGLADRTFVLTSNGIPVI